MEDDAAEVTNIQLEAGQGGNLLYDGVNNQQLYAGNTIAMELVFNTTVNYGEGAVVLNGTDSSSTDADSKFKFETATDENINNNYPFIANTGAVGGFDVSRLLRFSNTAKTFDATI